MTETPFRIESTDDGMNIAFDVAATTGDRQTKLAQFGDFEILCDESAAIGGDDTAPPPLAYFASALAFWLLTQLARVGEARKIELGPMRMTVTPTFTMSGSMLAGTAAHTLTSMKTSLDLEVELDPTVVASLVEQAERMCFVMDALARPHEVDKTVSLNGAPLDIDRS